jgi:hypothetical protein
MTLVLRPMTASTSFAKMYSWDTSSMAGLSDLTHESEWDDVIVCVKVKIMAVLRCAVTMEVKNTVSDVSCLTTKV